MMEDWELHLFLGVEDLPFPPLPEGSRLVIQGVPQFSCHFVFIKLLKIVNNGK